MKNIVYVAPFPMTATLKFGKALCELPNVGFFNCTKPPVGSIVENFEKNYYHTQCIVGPTNQGCCGSNRKDIWSHSQTIRCFRKHSKSNWHWFVKD